MGKSCRPNSWGKGPRELAVCKRSFTCTNPVSASISIHFWTYPNRLSVFIINIYRLSWLCFANGPKFIQVEVFSGHLKECDIQFARFTVQQGARLAGNTTAMHPAGESQIQMAGRSHGMIWPQIWLFLKFTVHKITSICQFGWLITNNHHVRGAIGFQSFSSSNDVPQDKCLTKYHHTMTIATQFSIGLAAFFSASPRPAQSGRDGKSP